MALSGNQRMLGRVLVLLGVLYGSFYVLYHQPEWTAWRPSSFSRAQHELSNSTGLPSIDEHPHESMLEKLWHPDQIGQEVHSSGVNAWKEHNGRALRALLGCMATDTCTEHQTKVVIAQEPRFRWAFIEDSASSGEQIFARSILNTFDSLGVTYMFSLDTSHLAYYYSLIPDLIRAVVMDPGDVEDCWHQGADDDCLKTSLNPLGTPIHHMFTPEFFGSQGHTPFGPEWTLIPEDYPHVRHNTYLGYSIEAECMKKEVPAYADRRRQVWVLGKWAHYFTSEKFPLNNQTFVKAAEALDIEFVSAWQDESWISPDLIPAGVRNIGNGKMLSKTGFEEAVVQTLAIVGLWDPVVSPTPWYGLCWGLPFMNPTIQVDDRFESQHNTARLIGEPYVYNYPPHDDDAFIEMLRKAIEPHERYVPPGMTQPEMDRRTLAWLERDWKGLVEERMQVEPYSEWVAGKDFLL